MRKLALRTAVCLVALAALVGAQSAGTPVQPTANPLFQDTRLVPVRLTFTAKEFDALRPIRNSGGGDHWLQGAEGKRNGL